MYAARSFREGETERQRDREREKQERDSDQQRQTEADRERQTQRETDRAAALKLPDMAVKEIKTIPASEGDVSVLQRAICPRPSVPPWPLLPRNQTPACKVLAEDRE